MSIKMKLVSCISAFILVLGIFIFGVLSAEQATVNLGGSISFEATDVYARVTGRVQNAQTNPTLAPLEFSADNDNPDQSSWSGLQLQFDSQATNITIEVTVENLSMERELTVNLTDMIETSADNLGKSITLDNGAYVSGTNTTVPVATSNDENNTSKVTFVITFDVLDHNRSLPSTTFDYDINLMDESTIPETYQPFEFEVIEGTENEVRITKHNGSGDVVIPASFSVDSIPLTSFTMQSENDASIGMGSIALYLGEFYYTETGGERTKTNMLEFSNLLQSESLTFPITFEPTYRYEFEGYSDINAMLLLYAIIGPSEAGYTDNINYNLTNDEFATGRDFTTQEMISYITENYPNAESDPTALAPLFATGTTILETNPIVSTVMMEGTDYVVTEIAAATAENTGHYVEYFGSFSNNETITNIYIPNTVRSIGNNAFGIDYSGHYTSNLKSVVFEDNSQLESIGDYAFRMCKNLTTIDFGENSQLTNIGDYAFNSCSGLTTVNFGENSQLTSIVDYAFMYCTSLTSITIPSSVTSIGSNAFRNCSGLTSITIEEGVTSIGDYAFMYCTSLTSITIPSSVTSIGAYAFHSCSSLTTVNFGENSQLTSVGPYAFDGCNNLRYNTDEHGVNYLGNDTNLNMILVNDGTLPDTTYEISSTCKIICSNAFYENLTLENINIPTSVTNIGGQAFYRCESLTTVIFGTNSQLTSIGERAFYNCSSLTSITIPANIKDIGSSAFMHCYDLTTITIPASVTSIGDSAFLHCYSLTSIEVEQANVNYSSENGILFNKDKTILIQYPQGNTRTSYIIPESVTSIGYNAFYDCSGLTSITIGEGVTSIGDDAFEGCRSLTSITIPDSVTSIGNGAFSNCWDLTSITIGEGVTSIGGDAFSACTSLTSITIPDSVTSIGNGAFFACDVSEVTIDSSYAYKNAGGASDDCGNLLADANTVYVNSALITEFGADANSYLNENFGQPTDNGNGYYVYTRN